MSSNLQRPTVHQVRLYDFYETARSLAQSYEINQIRADLDYKDKIGIVTGPVRNISRNVYTGLAVVTLSTVTKEAWEARNEHVAKLDIACYFSNVHENAVATLCPRQSNVKMIGKVIGVDGFHVTLIGCRVIY